MANSSLSQEKSINNNPEVPSKTAVYIGCLMYLYGPLIINIASGAGIGDMRNLLFSMEITAHATRTIANKIITPAITGHINFDVVKSSNPINMN